MPRLPHTNPQNRGVKPLLHSNMKRHAIGGVPSNVIACSPQVFVPLAYALRLTNMMSRDKSIQFRLGEGFIMVDIKYLKDLCRVLARSRVGTGEDAGTR
jgi:hypothetical protein